jgi:hypothetical protein
MEGKGLKKESDTSLVSEIPASHFQINTCALTKQGSVDSWKKAVLNKSSSIEKISSQKREIAHNSWWQRFWNRNYIFITAKDTANLRQAENRYTRLHPATIFKCLRGTRKFSHKI